MNKAASMLLSVLLITSSTASAQAGQLWGMTATGGANGNKGTIFHVGPQGSGFQKVFDFTDTSGWDPEGPLCLAPNGKLYGTTLNGGLADPPVGTLFSYDPNGAGFHKILDFDLADPAIGGSDWAGMVLGTDGMLYGASSGWYTASRIYRLDPTTDSYAVLHELDTDLEGNGVFARLHQGSDGWLYGVAKEGGLNNAGTIFRYLPATNEFEKLHDFTDGAGGRRPMGTLCEADNGWFYGTTYYGGTGDWGLVFKYHPGSGQFVVVFDLVTLGSGHNWNHLVRYEADKLIGTMVNGGLCASGVLYSVTPSSDAVQVISNWVSSDGEGGGPIASATLASDGRLYGTTTFGNAYNRGAVYGFDPTTNERSIIHEFEPTNDGYHPHSDLVELPMNTSSSVGASPLELTVTLGTAAGEVIVACPALTGPADLRILDAVGRVVLTRRITSAVERFSMPCSAGHYTVTVTSRDKQASRRIVLL